MDILKSIDIEDVVRLALAGRMNAYVRPLPADYETPCLLIQQVGGTDLNKIDTFDVVIDSRASLPAEASDYLRTAIALIKAVAKEQTTDIRYVEVNSIGSWGNDPVRPDLAMMSARLRVVAHQNRTNFGG